jgi:uncharacterized protein YggU (UPF0235/DUF167 family)
VGAAAPSSGAQEEPTVSGATPRAAIRVPVRVTPGASRPRVGGQRLGALVVAVRARAVEGAATEAALAAVAAAFGVRRRDVHLVRGATSRDKLFEVAGDPALLDARLTTLLGAPEGGDSPGERSA